MLRGDAADQRAQRTTGRRTGRGAVTSTDGIGEAAALRLGARLVTTRKDLVRLPASLRAGISALGVELRFADSAAFGRLVDEGLAARW